jgi:hypothetical protein
MTAKDRLLLHRRAQGGHDVAARRRSQKGTAVVGEFNPAYAMLPLAGFHNIVTTFPNAKFIYVVRDLVDRFWSQLRFKKGRLPSSEGNTDFDPNEHFLGAAAPWLSTKSRTRRTYRRASI